MNREELVEWMVLNEISDNYENVDQFILSQVVKIGAKFGFTIERSDIVDALARLIAGGLAKAYLLSGFEPFATELPGMPPLDIIEENFKTYFSITPEGLQASSEMDDRYLNKDTWWPYDDATEP